MYSLMSQKLHRRSVLIGLGSAAVIGSASGAGTTAAELSEATQLSGDLSSTVESAEIVTTMDPAPTVAADGPIPTTDSTSEVVVSESIETALTASVPDAGSVESGSTIDLWAGKVDTAAEGGPSGVADEELTIEVTRPDDETEEFVETTDGNGSVTVEYSVPEDVPGQYQATIAGTDDFDASVVFDVGPVLESTGQTGRSRPVLTGSTARFRFLLLDGQEPVTDETVTITVNDADDSSTLDEETVTTGANGFAEITVEPSETGEYILEATATVDDRELTATEWYPVSEIGYEYDFFSLDDLLAGREAAQGGRVWSGDGPLADTEIELQYSNEEADVEITETATTDENGFFTVRFDAPTDVDELDVALETTDGRSAALGVFEDSVDINEPDVDDEEEPEAEVDADFEEFRTAPGETTTLNVSAIDADGDPIADATVNVAIRFGWSGDGAPVGFTSVETDADGEATLAIDVPENAPDNSRLNASLTLDREEDTLTDDDSIRVRSVDAGAFTTFDDGNIEISLDATETATGDPVEGYNTYIDVQYISGRTGSVLGDRLLSDADGSDTTSVASPADLSYMVGLNYLSETDGTGGFSVQRGPYPGQLSTEIEPGEAVEPGTDLALEYEIEADSASGLLYGSVGDVPIAATFDTTETEPSIPIPENVVDDSARVRVWAVGSDGAPYSGSTFVSVDPDAEPEPTAEFSVTDLEPETATLEAGDELSVSATVTNTGDASGTGTAEVLLDDDVQATVDLDLDVDATEDIAETIGTDDLESGEYTYAVETDDDSGSGTLQIETPEDELPEEGEHESGVDQELFDAVDRDGDGELNRGDVRNMINQYAQSGEVDGVPLNRGDVRDLINFYALQ